MATYISTCYKDETDKEIILHKPLALEETETELVFRDLTPETMSLIWRYLLKEKGRTCDFSYGGMFIWAPLFNYQYAIFNNTLFIKGKMEGDFSRSAFSLPIGEMSLSTSVSLLKEWCKIHNEVLRFSAIPEYAVHEFELMNPSAIIEQRDWEDYLYDINSLATLAGRKMSKKRNHVNKFESEYPNRYTMPLNASNVDDAREVLSQCDASESAMANDEYALCVKTLEQFGRYNLPMTGMILYVNNTPVAFTIGDIKNETLYIHIEKANREYAGAYEAINKYFAEYMLNAVPKLKYINREDDAGSPGLRYAKQSYHPIELLKKYDIIF